MRPPQDLTRENSRRQIVIYLLLVFGFSALFYFLILAAHGLRGAGGVYTFGLMWCPALAGMLTLKLHGRNLSELGWKWPRTRYAAASWFIPLLYATITYAIVWGVGWGGVPNRQFMAKLVGTMGLNASPAVSTTVYVLFFGTFGIVRSMASALGEEIGWRGFLVPKLAKTFSYTTTALISGIVWACWHYPILISGGYNGGTPAWYSLTCFTVMVLAISFVFASMRLRSGSLWTGAILHGSHNLYIQAMFTPMTLDTGRTKWFIDEFGAVLPVVCIAFAIYFWTKRGELRGTPDEAVTVPVDRHVRADFAEDAA